ncbi:Predicted amidophosphoribosyltransferases [Paracoccus aminovorans]|uniref:Predicted amidophosphoribosyltransferases n=1 Tax=Paracoccus aminovorans TaxID=34004 RepID=A0A1I3E4U2_9RHOB|nr:double zinc ribbon domain-containing protein [Paracoccus aminovorans]CQR84909.1 competence protein F [Paracoccus aminovorans]SFH93994.1 Predicted amidophosphoribosyltransferases [Paracoccus aminovorans]
MKGALRLVYPPQCLSCGAPVAEEGGLCPDCWREADFIQDSCCSRCGVPLPGDGLEDAADEAAGLLVCDDCLAVQRPWLRGRAALAYRGTGRKLALMLKHSDRLDLAPVLGDWVARAAQPLVRPDMLVVPVPVHLRRLLKRKYNQAELLAQRVARAHGLAHRPQLLRRIRHTPMQDHGSVADRFANVDGALVVPARMAPLVEGRAVLLVDDVMASGATLAAAAEALRAAGAGPISVVVLARAVKDT